MKWSKNFFFKLAIVFEWIRYVLYYILQYFFSASDVQNPAICYFNTEGRLHSPPRGGGETASPQAQTASLFPHNSEIIKKSRNIRRARRLQKYSSYNKYYYIFYEKYH